MQAKRKSKKCVGFAQHQYIKKYILGYCYLSNRILLVKLKDKPFYICIIVVYTATIQTRIEKLTSFTAHWKKQEPVQFAGNCHHQRKPWISDIRYISWENKLRKRKRKCKINHFSPPNMFTYFPDIVVAIKEIRKL